MDTDLGTTSFSEVEMGPPPGDEGFDISHKVFEDLAQGIAALTG